MSNGLKDAIRYVTVGTTGSLTVSAKDPLAGGFFTHNGTNVVYHSGDVDDPWDLNEEYASIDKIAEDFVKKTKNRDPFAWLDPVCDCGCEKTYGKGSNIHSHWCSAKK